MDINKARKMLEGLNKLETGNRNDVKPGTFQCLINEVSMQETRDFRPYIRAKATVLVPIMDGKGVKPETEGYAGHYKGEEISFCFFFGDRFQKDFSPFLCAALDISPEAAKEVSGEELREMALAVIKCDDQPSGILDNKVVIEMRGVESAPVEDSKNPGQLKIYINERFDKNVKLSSLVEKLDEQDMERYFGSVEAFTELMAEEEAE